MKKNEMLEFESILETYNAGDRVFLKSILDAEGITYYIQGEYVAPYFFNALPMRLMVRKDQVKIAREILQDVQLSFSYGSRNDVLEGEEKEED